MLKLKTATPRWIIILIDLIVSIFSLGLAYFIRFDLNTNLYAMKNEWIEHWPEFITYLCIKGLIFYLFGIHKGLVRYTSIQDSQRILKANLSATLIFIIISAIRANAWNTTYLFPSSIILMEFIISLMFLIGSRFVIKLWYIETVKSIETSERVLIYGAGAMGLIAKRTIENDNRIQQKIIGFIDNNQALVGNRIDGIKVYDATQLEQLLDTLTIEKVIVAIRKPNPELLRTLVDICLLHQVKIQRVQDPNTWVNGELTPKKIGKIDISELLGRAHIELNQGRLSNDLDGKTVIITGAAGSIGSGIARELTKYNVKHLILLDQAESPLYDLQQELKIDNLDFHIQFRIGDIRNKETINKLFNEFNPQIIFHAAAYKHVPLMEENPYEAISTNIIGTKNLTECAIQYKLEKFIFISTDKAVNPTNIMGASKRIAEMIVQEKNNNGITKFITTRFGNVLGSNGSVIPLFQRQIAQGGPVTLTDERITRFFMTIPEACQLVLEAFSMGNGGEIYVFDMGESVRIIDLARKMILLHGLEPDKDIEIKITGLRPGEKLYEELLADSETTLPTHHPKILIAKTRQITDEFEPLMEELIEKQSNIMLSVSVMKQIVPEFISKNSLFQQLDAN
jgi:FlaA1/EpsC-like NDP-sugar epimerase